MSEPKTYFASLTAARMITPEVRELRFAPTEPLSFAAGQYLWLHVPGASDDPEQCWIPFSIASPPTDPELTLIVKLGPHRASEYVLGLNPGDRLRFRAPCGVFRFVRSSRERVFFIAGGTGLAPFRSILLSDEFQSDPPRELILLLGAEYEQELLYVEQLKELPFVTFIPAVTHPTPSWSGFSGLVSDYLDVLPDTHPWTEFDYFLCGAPQMIEVLRQSLARRGVPDSAIFDKQ